MRERKEMQEKSKLHISAFFHTWKISGDAHFSVQKKVTLFYWIDFGRA